MADKKFDFSDKIAWLIEFGTGIFKTAHMNLNGVQVVQLQEAGAHEAADNLIIIAEWLARLEERLNCDHEDDETPVESLKFDVIDTPDTPKRIETIRRADEIYQKTRPVEPAMERLQREYKEWRKQAGDAYELSDCGKDCMCDRCLQVNGLAQLIGELDIYLDAARDAKPRCPDCGARLMVVHYPAGSMLNEEQWESVRAGDFYCDSCNAHYWQRELSALAEVRRLTIEREESDG